MNTISDKKTHSCGRCNYSVINVKGVSALSHGIQVGAQNQSLRLPISGCFLNILNTYPDEKSSDLLHQFISTAEGEYDITILNIEYYKNAHIGITVSCYQ